MSETSNVRAARYATNLGFKDPSLLLMRLRRGGNSLQNAQPSPQARERQSESSRLVGLSSEGASFLLFVRPTPIDICRGVLLPTRWWRETRHARLRRDHWNVATGRRGGRGTDRHGRMGRGGRGRDIRGRPNGCRGLGGGKGRRPGLYARRRFAGRDLGGRRIGGGRDRR